MRSVTIELPDRLASELDEIVRAGWFESEGEAVRVALRDMIRQHRPELMERFQQEDIAWALRAKDQSG